MLLNVDVKSKFDRFFQKDGSEFSDVILSSEDDNDNSDVIVLKKLEKFS